MNPNEPHSPHSPRPCRRHCPTAAAVADRRRLAPAARGQDRPDARASPESRSHSSHSGCRYPFIGIRRKHTTKTTSDRRNPHSELVARRTGRHRHRSVLRRSPRDPAPAMSALRQRNSVAEWETSTEARPVTGEASASPAPPTAQRSMNSTGGKEAADMTTYRQTNHSAHPAEDEATGRMPRQSTLQPGAWIRLTPATQQPSTSNSPAPWPPADVRISLDGTSGPDGGGVVFGWQRDMTPEQRESASARHLRGGAGRHRAAARRRDDHVGPGAEPDAER